MPKTPQKISVAFQPTKYPSGVVDYRVFGVMKAGGRSKAEFAYQIGNITQDNAKKWVFESQHFIDRDQCRRDQILQETFSEDGLLRAIQYAKAIAAKLKALNKRKGTK